MMEPFPFSKLAKRGPVLRVYAIEHIEPPLFEREFSVGTEIDPILEAAREFMAPDCACEVDTYWDLWRYFSGASAGAAQGGEPSQGDWKLAPATVTLACFGPDYANEHGDQLRIEFGPDAQFVPSSSVEGSVRMVQSNLKSLLHLVGDLERALDLEKRQVWSESGANFADVLKRALGTFHVN